MDYKKDKKDTIIKEALICLMREKEYQEINISEIIEKSEISRSTFYSRYKKKDDILVSYINSIMNHVFDEHHFNGDEHTLVHIFEHMKEQKDDIKLILDSTASHVFRKALRKRLKVIVDSFYANGLYGKKDIPSDLAIHQYLNDLISLIQYYVHHGENISPEEITKYYLKIFN